MIKQRIITSICVICFCTSGWTQLMFENFNDANCGEVTSPGCHLVNHIDNNCLPEWLCTHGSPNTVSDKTKDHFKLQPFNITIPIDGEAVMMVDGCPNSQNTGEGMFSSFNFEKEQCYLITIDFAAFNTGNLIIGASNGLVAKCGSCCSTPITVDETILNQPLNPPNPGSVNTWNQLSVIYNPAQNFSQFSIHPLGPGNGQTAVIVDNISISEVCPAIINLKDPSQGIPSGIVHASNKMIVGSPNISDFVTNIQTANTTLHAGNYITLLGNTCLDVSGTGSVLIETKPCAGHEDCDRPADPKEDETVLVLNGSLSVFPNPSTGIININLPEVLEEETTFLVEVFDQFYGTIHSEYSKAGTLIKMDLSDQKNGLYFVRAYSGKYSFISKVILDR